MNYKVNFTPEFRTWLYEQEEKLQDIILARIDDLKEKDPHLGRPRTDTHRNSKMSNLKEFTYDLIKGDLYRILYAFDCQRETTLLVGGNKAGGKKWYKNL